MHRLNNILVLAFYQNEPIKGQTGAAATSDTTSCSTEIPENTSDGEDDVELSEMVFVDAAKTKINDLPDCAREFLKVLNNSKEIVRYVKLVS